jgi:hypothetical protein
MGIDRFEIDNRLQRLHSILEWVSSDVTASFEEKLLAMNHMGLIEIAIMNNRNGQGNKADLIFANSLWDSYTNALTGSNVPIKLKRLVEVQ